MVKSVVHDDCKEGGVDFDTAREWIIVGGGLELSDLCGVERGLLMTEKSEAGGICGVLGIMDDAVIFGSMRSPDDGSLIPPDDISVLDLDQVCFCSARSSSNC